MAGVADTDYLAAEPLLVARLESELDASVAVKTAEELAGLDELSQKTEAVYVIYDGDSPGGNAGDGSRAVMKQRWMTVVAVRNRNTLDGEKARRKAGELMAAVNTALAGYKLGQGFLPIIRVGATPPGYSDTYGYFPIAFEVGTTH